MATWTEADVAALKAAIASGVQTVRYDGPPGRTVTYHSLADMRALLASMQRDVASASGSPPYRLIAFDKGL